MARVQGASGCSVSPETMPFSCAQTAAAVYHLPFGTSRKGFSPAGSGEPLMRQMNVRICEILQV